MYCEFMFLMVRWAGLQCMIVVFPGHTYFFGPFSCVEPILWPFSVTTTTVKSYSIWVTSPINQSEEITDDQLFYILL